MAQAQAITSKTPSPPIGLGRRLLFGGMGVGVGILTGATIWAFDALSGQHHDYTVTGLTLSLILGGIGFFAAPGKNGWRDTFLYFLLLSFLDN
jgi:hypothetical protein